MRGMIIFALCVLFFGLVNPLIPDEKKADGTKKSPDQKILGSGVVFFTTNQLEEITDFYIDQIGCELWLDQENCMILKYGNLLIGFCAGKKSEPEGVVTFFYKSREDVDLQYQKFKPITIAPPKENRKYRIYHFYARDPEGRSIEFQHFLHPIDWDFGKFK